MNNKLLNKIRICFLRLIAYCLFIIHSYVGFMLPLRMLLLKYNIHWHLNLFWDNTNNDYKYPKYMHISFQYAYHPIVYIPISIIIFLFFIYDFSNINVKIKKKHRIYINTIICTLLILITCFVTVGALYNFWYEKTSEVV